MKGSRNSFLFVERARRHIKMEDIIRIVLPQSCPDETNPSKILDVLRKNLMYFLMRPM